MGSPNDLAPAGGYALSAERVIEAGPEAVFDAFIALYDSQRPDWVTSSRLDLRPGGRWTVEFQVPDGPAFREERLITALDRPRRLAYDMRARSTRIRPASSPPSRSPSPRPTAASASGWSSAASRPSRTATTSPAPGPTCCASWPGGWPSERVELDESGASLAACPFRSIRGRGRPGRMTV